MIKKNINPAAEAFRAGKKLSAAWLQAGSPVTAEILAEAGFDVLIIDLEHGPGDIMTLIAQIHAMKGEPATPFVRAPWNDLIWIKRILDAGAFGLIIPYVCTAEEAKAAVRAAKYPPEGIRGLAGSPRAAHYTNDSEAYFECANREIFLFAQIESREGVNNLDDILAVKGVDGVFIGPMDLATSFGYLGNPNVPEIQDVISSIEEKVFASGKTLATICSDFEDAKAKYNRGYQMIMLMHDTVTLSKMAVNTIVKYRKEVLGI